MLKKILFGFVVVLVLVVGGFAVWGSIAQPPENEAIEALQGSSVVQVSQGDWLVFQPSETQPTIGLIFYPGGRVDPRAYAPYALSLAEQGYLVVIPRMPFNLAVLNSDEAGQVIQAYPNIQSWVLGGHSLGGAMAAAYTARHAEVVDGLVLLAAYPSSSDSLADSDAAVVSISATEDGLATAEKVQAARSLLPSETRYVVIEGGNHAQFGWYGEQDGDGPAKISAEEQHTQTLQATLELLQRVAGPREEKGDQPVQARSHARAVCD